MIRSEYETFHRKLAGSGNCLYHLHLADTDGMRGQQLQFRFKLQRLIFGS